MVERKPPPQPRTLAMDGAINMKQPPAARPEPPKAQVVAPKPQAAPTPVVATPKKLTRD